MCLSLSCNFDLSTNPHFSFSYRGVILHNQNTQSANTDTETKMCLLFITWRGLEESSTAKHIKQIQEHKFLSPSSEERPFAILP